MIIAFELSMPSNNSWNGKWSGEGKSYSKIVNLGKTQKATLKAEALLAARSFYHNFGDGWCACVSVHEVDATEARRARRNSKGFYGYDWMVDSIIRNGDIRLK